MFRDKDEELKRLQEQLLEEEQPEEDFREELPDEVFFEDFPEESEPGEDPDVYRNFSNAYGKNLRNFASGYKAYNADKVDVDLDEFSREVQNERTDTPWLLIVILALMAAVVAAIVWFYVRLGGLQ